MSQPMVETHCVDANDPQSSSQSCYTNEAGTSIVPNHLALGNHEMSKGIKEISINYTSSGEVNDRSTTIETYASQPPLLKTSLMIQILRP
jgi:hypothetical protein